MRSSRLWTSKLSGTNRIQQSMMREQRVRKGFMAVKEEKAVPFLRHVMIIGDESSPLARASNPKYFSLRETLDYLLMRYRQSTEADHGRIQSIRHVMGLGFQDHLSF